MAMYDLLEYPQNYADYSGSLYQFKRDEQNTADSGNPENVTADANTGSSSFKYKSSILGSPVPVAVNANSGIAAHALLKNA